MDFGGLGFDGLVGPLCTSGQAGEALSPKLAAYLQMLPRSSKEGWKASRMPFSAGDLAAIDSSEILRSASLIIPAEPEPEECMLSFSTTHKPEATIAFLTGKDSTFTDSSSFNLASYGYYPTPASRLGGCSGNMNLGLRGAFSMVSGPFTPSQWMELEHQALIYKYIISNVPIPSNLLIPIKKYIHPSFLSESSAGSYQGSLGWSTFHMSYLGSTTDPEPGRCRRTDGKKWRCSRDAVADQKYCERHMNRGRHRSRKPVEGRTGHSATGTACKKPVSSSGAIVSSSVALDGLTKREDFDSCKKHLTATANTTVLEDPSKLQFGLVSSGSLNLSQSSAKNYEAFLNPNDRRDHHHSLRQFSDHHRSALFWPEEIKSDWTQLSMSIPAIPTEPVNDHQTSPSPAQVTPFNANSGAFDHGQLGMRKSDDLDELSQKQSTWIPISWETSMGGPLGEALATRATNEIKCTNVSSQRFIADEVDDSPDVGASPTGVWQKTTFDSLSNSCSPSAERKNIASGSLCSSSIASSVNFSSPIPLL